MQTICLKCILFAFCVTCCFFAYSSEYNKNTSIDKIQIESLKKDIDVICRYLQKKEKIFDDYINKIERKTFYEREMIQRYQKYYTMLHTKEITISQIEMLLLIVVRIQYSYTRTSDDDFCRVVLQMLNSNFFFESCFVIFMDYVSADFVDNNIESIIYSIKNNPQINRDLIRRIPFSALAKQNNRDFFNELVKESKEKIKQLEEKNDRKSISDRNKELLLCALFGDNESFALLLDFFYNSKGTDFYEYANILSILDTRESLSAIVSRFPENTGEPTFYTDSSPRFKILRILFFKFHEDPFFLPYRTYLEEPTVFSSPPNYPDSFIGGEEGVKKLFSDLQKWTQERLGIELHFEKSIPKINSGPQYERSFLYSPNQE